MRNMKVRTKLLASFAITVALTLFIGILALVNYSRNNTEYTETLDLELPGVYYLGLISGNLRGERSEMRGMYMGLLEGDGQMVAEAQAGLDANVRAVEDAYTQYAATIRPDDLEDQAIFDAFVLGYDAFNDNRDQYVSAVERGDAATAAGLLALAGEQLTLATNQVDRLISYRFQAADDISEQLDQRFFVNRTIVIVVLLVIAALSMFIGFYMAAIISRPLAKMKTVLDQVADTGSLEFSNEVMAAVQADAVYRDELGTSLHSFDRMMQRFLTMADELKHLAEGDLTRTVEPIGPQDTMANAVNTLIENLNAMFIDINNSSLQVASGSQQMSAGAQSLAQGASEQAAAVQQLSASIQEIASSSKEAALSAQNASSLGDTIRRKAEQGSDQMQDLMTAVREINEASRNIERVIAVIDNIAFQTNILALNASVEAAHAGVHGKGFAVVAEEVRTLATKSSEAARDTGELIKNSIGKAELGAKIAADTNASLQEIVTGINESSVLVDDIAKNAEGQAEAITQISTGVDQVAQVVQHNSATAEESAAASQAMSSQSHVLQSLIARFKIKNNLHGKPAGRLPGTDELPSLSGRPGEASSPLPAKPVEPVPADLGKY